jgi:Ger(x)C family germination protein
MKQRILLSLLFLLSLFTAGCWDQKIIEKKSFIRELGLESLTGREIFLTFVAPQINGQAGKHDESRERAFTTEANLIREGIKRGDLFAGGDIETGEIQHLLFSEELAHRGIHKLLEAFERDPAQPLQASLLIVEGSPSQLLKEMVRNKTFSSFYLEKILKRANQSYISQISTGDFQVAYFTPGIDPILPLIKQVQEEVSLSGTALFAQDRMVGKLDLGQTAFLLAMMNKLEHTEMFFKSPHWTEKGENLKKGIAVFITKARRKLALQIKNKRPELKIALRFKGNLLEYHWDRLDSKKSQTEIEKRLASEIRESCRSMIRYTQQVGSDPIGFGNLIRAKYNSDWKKLNWTEAYRNAEIKIDVRLELEHYGLIN